MPNDKPFLVSTERIPGVQGYRTFASFKDAAAIDFALYKDRLVEAAGFEGEVDATHKTTAEDRQVNAGTRMGTLTVSIRGGKTETKNYYGGVHTHYAFQVDANIKISGVPACCTAVETHNPAISIYRTSKRGFASSVLRTDPTYIAFTKAFFDLVVAICQRCGYSIVNGHHHPESCYQYSGWPMIAQWVADRSQHHMALWATIIPPFDKNKDEAIKLGITRDGVYFTPKPVKPVVAAPIAANVPRAGRLAQTRRCPTGRFADFNGLCGYFWCEPCTNARHRQAQVA